MSLEVYLGCLFGAEPTGALAELRISRPGGGMDQRFYSVREVEEVAAAIRQAAPSRDVYIGVAPRTRREGTRDAVERVHVLWADCDSAESIEALAAFEPAPSIILGSGHGQHAYWSLCPPVSPSEVESANRRLAVALGADLHSTDAARVLRPPESFNHKRGEMRPVTTIRMEAEIFALADLLSQLPADPESRQPRRPRDLQSRADDVLETIAPPIYVETLTGRQVGRDGKISCPFHDDRTPSLHVYPEPGEGWFCFGCQRSGSIYDLAAEISGLGTRGAEFTQLRGWIAQRLLNAPVAG